MTKIAERLEAHPAWTESTLITALSLSVTVTVCVSYLSIFGSACYV